MCVCVCVQGRIVYRYKKELEQGNVCDFCFTEFLRTKVTTYEATVEPVLTSEAEHIYREDISRRRNCSTIDRIDLCGTDTYVTSMQENGRPERTVNYAPTRKNKSSFDTQKRNNRNNKRESYLGEVNWRYRRRYGCTSDAFPSASDFCTSSSQHERGCSTASVQVDACLQFYASRRLF